jgi:hypothetical protein
MLFGKKERKVGRNGDVAVDRGCRSHQEWKVKV